MDARAQLPSRDREGAGSPCATPLQLALAILIGAVLATLLAWLQRGYPWPVVAVELTGLMVLSAVGGYWLGANHSREAELTRQVEELSADLQDARFAAGAAQRAKAAFLANLGHEIRTPLTAVLGYTAILRERIGDPDRLAELERIESSSRSLLGLFNDLLELARRADDPADARDADFLPEAASRDPSPEEAPIDWGGSVPAAPNPAKLAEALTNRFQDRWTELSELLVMDDIRILARDLAALAADHECPPLAEYARRLTDDAVRYDVPRVRKALAELPEIPARIHPTSDESPCHERRQIFPHPAG